MSIRYWEIKKTKIGSSSRRVSIQWCYLKNQKIIWRGQQKIRGSYKFDGDDYFQEGHAS